MMVLLLKERSGIDGDIKDAASKPDFKRAADLRNKLYALKGF